MFKLRELTAFFNKQYRDAQDGKFLLLLQQAFLKKMLEMFEGTLPSHIFYADDLFVVYRNLGFLSDADFVTAWNQVSPDDVIRGRIWRVWILCWTLHQATSKNGTVLDLGCYNGEAIAVALAYTKLKRKGINSRVIVADLFEDPPTEAKKRDHSATLHIEVEERLSSICPVTVVKGFLPNSLDRVNIESVVWCQIDLNSASSDYESLEYIWSKAVPGAFFILDDYGFSRYESTKQQIDCFCQTVDHVVLELPTGQGLIIKMH